MLGEQAQEEGKVVTALLCSLEFKPDHRVLMIPARDRPQVFY
jgi:hypothetical protein